MKRFGIDRFTALLAALAALAGALILLRGSNYGAAVIIDSRLYLSVAGNLLEGNGFAEWPQGSFYRDGAPIFPLALAGVGLFGVEIIDAALFVNAAAFGLTVFAAALWLRRRVASRFLVFWAVCACALCVSLTHISAFVLTEPLFILFTTLSLFGLDRFLDTRQRSLLLMAAICAALAWLTRYIGVTLVASALLLLVLHRGVPLSARIRNAALYAVIAGTPICLWMLRNFLHTRAPLGDVYPTGFSLTSSLQVAGEEILSWVLGSGHSLTAALGIEVSEIVSLSLNIGFLLTLASGAGYALIRLRRRGYAQSWSIWAVPVTFVSVYALFLMVHLPLTNVDLAGASRYLAPLYVPTLVAVTLFLNEVLRCAAHTQLFATSFLPKWRVGTIATASWPALALSVCLSFWLLPHLHANYRNIQSWMDHGFGYASKPFRNSSVVRYVKDHLIDGYVWTNSSPALSFLIGGRIRLQRLPHALPRSDDMRLRDMHRWLGEAAWIARVEPYFVWFRRMQDPRYDYGPAELAALPGVQIVAVLEDGYIFKAGPQHADDAESREATASLDTALKGAGRSVIDSEFDVYLDKRENTLIYVREDCRDDDLETPVFLHVFPMRRADLPDHRRSFTFDNLDFSFGERALRLDGWCIAARGLPDYPVARILTGQWVPGKGRVWEGEVNLFVSIVDVIEHTQPVIDSEFDVYLNERENTLIYVREDCHDDDLEPPVFLHVFPTQRTDLPDHRRSFAYDNLDFSFGEQALRLDGRCIAARGLPDYPVARILTGQWVPGKGRIWEGEVNLNLSIADIIENTQPVIRSHFDVYLDANWNRLIYVREDCRDDDLDAPVFLHVFPMRRADLPDRRRRSAFDNLDFSFGERALQLDGRCIAARGLPDYPVARILTGQGVSGKGRIWGGEVNLVTLIVGIIEKTEPVIRSHLDVYLDANWNRLIYVREDCRDDDHEASVFLHVFPVRRADLPDHRRSFAFDNLDFSFGEGALRLGGRCIAARGLPDYLIARIVTGQGVPGKGHIWEGEVDSVTAIVDIPATSIVGIIEKTEPVIRSDFDVYLDENENRLIYVREDCRDDDLDAPGFLHVFPMQRADLSDRRRGSAFDNFDFSFGERALRLGRRCVAVRHLPDYPVARIVTGQEVPGKGRVWEGEVNLNLSIAGIMENTQPVIRSDFDVYLDENENRLIYVREDCRDDDRETPVFLHVFPMRRADLPDRRSAFDNFDFSFGERALRLDGQCIAVRHLPDYPVARIVTGQWVPGKGRIWEGEVNLSLSIADIMEKTQPVIRSRFDVYLDTNWNRLIYVREDCRDDDLDAPVFLHVFPMRRADLPERRRRSTFDNLDFSFGKRALRLDGQCIAVRHLSDYPVARIRTGQWVPGKGRIWGGEVNLNLSIADIMENNQPAIRSHLDVYLDANWNRLIYVREDCRDDDLDAPVFLHVFPMRRADLPDHRRRSVFDNLDFSFGERALRLDGQCIAVRYLPDYPVARIQTGQGDLWTSEFSLD